MTRRWMLMAIAAVLLLAARAGAQVCPAYNLPAECCEPAEPPVCYEMKVPLDAFTTQGSDEFGGFVATGGFIRRLCLPAVPADVFGPHRAMVSIDGLPNPNVARSLSTPLGTFDVSIQRGKYLLVDALKDLTGPIAAAATLTTVHTCYAVDGKGPRTGVNYVDQFGPGAVGLDQTSVLCVPARIGQVEGIGMQLCFATKKPRVPGPLFQSPLWVKTPFGPFDSDPDRIMGVFDFCVPATAQ